MSPKKKAMLVQDATFALLAGVTLTRRDWIKMSDDERFAWLVARAQFKAPAPAKPTDVPNDPSDISEPHFPKPPTSFPNSPAPSPDLVRRVLEQGARECLEGEE